MPRGSILTFFILLMNLLLSHSYAKDTTTILVFGDSIVAGYGLGADEAIPIRMQTILQNKGYNVQVVNGGVSGDTSSGGRSRLEWTLTHSKPDMVIMAIGSNDMLRGISPALTRENMDAMLATLTAKKIKTILSAVQAPDNLGTQYVQEFNQIYPELAKKYHVPLAPFLLEATYGNQPLMQADGMHPSAAGANIIAKKLTDYMIQQHML